MFVIYLRITKIGSLRRKEKCLIVVFPRSLFLRLLRHTPEQPTIAEDADSVFAFGTGEARWVCVDLPIDNK